MKLFAKKPTVDEAKAKLARVEQELARLRAEQEARAQRMARLQEERGELLALQAIGERVDAARLKAIEAELEQLEKEQRDAQAVADGLQKVREEAAAAVQRAEAEDLYRRLHEAVLHHLEVWREFLKTRARLEELGREADAAKLAWEQLWRKFRDMAPMVPVQLPSGPFSAPETLEALEADVERVKEALKAGFPG